MPSAPPRRLALLATALLLLLPACAPAPRSPEQARLDGCLAKVDRDVIVSARVEPGNRFSYQYLDSGGSGAEKERFIACMQERAPAYPTVR